MIALRACKMYMNYSIEKYTSLEEDNNNYASEAEMFIFFVVTICYILYRLFIFLNCNLKTQISCYVCNSKYTWLNVVISTFLFCFYYSKISLQINCEHYDFLKLCAKWKKKNERLPWNTPLLLYIRRIGLLHLIIRNACLMLKRCIHGTSCCELCGVSDIRTARGWF